MRRLAPLIALTLLLAAASVAPGRASPSDRPCAPPDTINATVREIASHPESYRGECVSVSGLLLRTTLFADVDGIYQKKTKLFDPSSNGGRLGLSPTRWKIAGYYRDATVVGRVFDCEQMRDEVRASMPDNVIYLIGGYCHTSNGAYIGVERMHIGARARVERQLPVRAGPDYGNLEPAPADWEHLPLVHSFAALFLSALRRGDGEALASIHMMDRRERPAMLRFLLRDAQSPFASIRSTTRELQTIVLVERGRLGNPNVDKGDYTATICFCSMNDCSARWPIASWDADNDPSRPYACTQVVPWFTGSQVRPTFITKAERYGLDEPR